MGNCLITNGTSVPALSEYDEKNSDGGENFYDEIVYGLDVDYFKVAVQNCVSVSIGVASRNVVVYNVIRSPAIDGIDVTYSVSDVYGRTTAKDIRKHIDRSITSGKFTSLLHQHGFLTAEARELIKMPDAMKPKKSLSEEAVTRVLLVHITQTFTGVDLPTPKKAVEKSPTGFQNLITNARRSIRSPKSPIPSTPSQNDIQVTATVAAELDYTTPAFKTALQQSVANAAGVPPEAVTIFEIKPSPSGGQDLEILYSVDGLSPSDTVSDFKARIDKAVSSGWFTSSLQGDGYFGVSAKAPTAVIRLAFTMKQTISVAKKSKKSRSDESVRSETDEHTPLSTARSSHSRRSTSKSKRKSGRPDSARSTITKETRPNSNETVRTSETKQDFFMESSVMNALRSESMGAGLGVGAGGSITRQSTMDEIPEEEPPTILESMVSEKSAPTTPMREKSAPTTPQRDSALDEARSIRMDEEHTYAIPPTEPLVRRNSCMWSASHEDRVLRAAVPDVVQPLSPGSKDIIPEASLDTLNSYSGTPAEEVKAERSLTPPHLRYHAGMSQEEADIVEEQRRLLGLKDDVARLKREEECHTQKETDERLQKIEDLHRLREIEKQVAASEAKTKEEEVFRIKREEGRAIALAAELRRGSTMETRKIRLEDSKNAFEVVKMKSAKYGAGLDAASVAADRADEMHRRSSLQVPKKKIEALENRRASVGDTARTKLRKKPPALLDTEDAFDLAPIKTSPKKSSPKKSSQSSPKILSAYDTYISGSDDNSSLLAKELPKSPTAEAAWGTSMWQTLSSLSTGRREGE